MALGLVEKFSATGQTVVITQVLIELYNMFINQQKIPAYLAAELISSYAQWPAVESDLALVQSAIAHKLQPPKRSLTLSLPGKAGMAMCLGVSAAESVITLLAAFEAEAKAAGSGTVCAAAYPTAPDRNVNQPT